MWRIGRPPTASPTFAGSASTSAGHAEPALGEPLVVRERVAEVADADDHDRPVLREPELAADLVDQVRDVVADAARPVGAQVRQVLADLRRVHAGGLGERLGRDGRGAATRRCPPGLAGRRGSRPTVASGIDPFFTPGPCLFAKARPDTSPSARPFSNARAGTLRQAPRPGTDAAQSAGGGLGGRRHSARSPRSSPDRSRSRRPPYRRSRRRGCGSVLELQGVVGLDVDLLERDREGPELRQQDLASDVAQVAPGAREEDDAVTHRRDASRAHGAHPTTARRMGG